MKKTATSPALMTATPRPTTKPQPPRCAKRIARLKAARSEERDEREQQAARRGLRPRAHGVVSLMGCSPG